MSDFTNKNDSYRLLLAFIDKKAIGRARLLTVIIATGGALSLIAFLWLWLLPPSNMAVLIFLASLAVITAGVSIVLVIVYLVLLVMTMNTGKPYIAFPTLSVVKRVIHVKDAFIDSLPPEDRPRAREIIEYWEKTLYDGGEVE
ncbi:hypothetical protein GM182_02060 [bacterium 3DAC]|jgi:hypothetical protein|nr:hypothetical protein GM182_02060 [bacterium 3DAC]